MDTENHHLNSAHLTACLGTISTPQLRLSLHSALDRIQLSTERLTPGLKVSTGHTKSTPSSSCTFCHTKIDLTRSKMETVKLGRRKTISQVMIYCYLCKKEWQSKEVTQKSINVNTSSGKKTSFQDLLDTNKFNKKKKKCFKEENAGLKIPDSSSKSNMKVNSSSKIGFNKSMMSKDKLKLLMSKSEAPKKGSLADFLKKL